jgi:hypothetical protein
MHLHVNLDTSHLLAGVIHGRHAKDLVVLHETVSGDLRGLADITGVESYLARIGYGIHGMTDREGNIAWARGDGDAIFYHCGGVNERSIGIEQVFRGATDKPRDRVLWAARQPELRATAKLLAAIANTWRIPLRYSDGDHPGVTSHWSVSQHHPESQGHWDCHPIHLGGYYPALAVINLARTIAKTGLRL